MHAFMNASFGSQMPEIKMGYIDHKGQGVLRYVTRYIRERAGSRMHNAFSQCHHREEMMFWGKHHMHHDVD
jgi:hypothetical protein